LVSSFATKGKGDDTSLAGIVSIEAIKKVLPIWKKQIESEDSATDIAAQTDREQQPKKLPEFVKSFFSCGIHKEKTIEKYGQFIIHKIDIKV
jgi:hypothetical protein